MHFIGISLKLGLFCRHWVKNCLVKLMSTSMFVRNLSVISVQFLVNEAIQVIFLRTNRLCEGWNNNFARLVGHSHPTIWNYIAAFQEDEVAFQTLFRLSR